MYTPFRFNDFLIYDVAIYSVIHDFSAVILLSCAYVFLIFCFIVWLWWVFINACGLSLVVASGGYSPVAEHRLFIVVASLVAEHGL